MSMDEDPISQFFPDQEDVDLYQVLSVRNEATQDDIKKAYRRLALVYHPDKHATATDVAKAEASTKFQQIGFAYSVLSDPKRQERYDKTGRTDEGFELDGEGGWQAYFEAMFERVTHGKLDELKKEYQGSAAEVDDLKAAYLNTGGSIGDIMSHIPHSTYEDEERFIIIISNLISRKTLPPLDKWDATVTDKKAKLVRKKQGQKESKEAEQLAKDLGVWEEFYGIGSPTHERETEKGKRKRKAERSADDLDDHSALQTVILKKQKKMDGFFDSLAAKYTEPACGRSKGKKRARDDDPQSQDGPSRKSRSAVPDIDDQEFTKLREKLFGNEKGKKSPAAKSNAKKGKRT